MVVLTAERLTMRLKDRRNSGSQPFSRKKRLSTPSSPQSPIVFFIFPLRMKHPSSAVRLSALCAAVLTLVACKASLTDNAFRGRAEAHIRANINDISTRSPVVGGRFEVKDIEWIDDDTVRISFEDGHVALKGMVDVQMNDTNTVAVSRLRIENDKDDDADDDSDKDDDDKDDNDDEDDKDASAMSSSNKSSGASTSATSSGLSSGASVSSASSRAGAGVGEFCGGIAGIMCDSGLTCDYDGTYPDAGGTCVQG